MICPGAYMCENSGFRARFEGSLLVFGRDFPLKNIDFTSEIILKYPPPSLHTSIIVPHEKRTSPEFRY